VRFLLAIVTMAAVAGLTPATASADICRKITVREGTHSYEKTVCFPSDNSYDKDTYRQNKNWGA
jgi:hypothetical protein